MGILYIVATPIGNLKDITLRALEILKDANLILAEDTRVTKKLLSHFEIKKPVIRYDEYATDKIYSEVLKKLNDGQKIALLTDAGTPGISDPGSRLVSFVINHLSGGSSSLSKVIVIPIPGPSAITTALSASGINANQFTFLGYPPHKKGRETFFKNLKNTETRPIVFYESPYRMEKALNSLSAVFGENHEIVVARELTKIHEEIFRGEIKKAKFHFKGERLKGEFVLIIS